MRNHRGGRGSIGLILLAIQLYRNFPILKYIPVTSLILLSCISLYLLPMFNVIKSFNIEDMALYSYLVLENFQVHRIFTNAFFHLSDFHLYYNMSSLIFKGRFLETKLGPTKYFSIVTVLLVLCNLIHISLAFLIFKIFRYGHYYFTGSVGLSGLLFALKVITTKLSGSNYSSVMGIQFPIKYVYWIELLLIYLINPYSSLLSHVSGILAGLTFTHNIFTPTIVNFIDRFIIQLIEPPDNPYDYEDNHNLEIENDQRINNQNNIHNNNNNNQIPVNNIFQANNDDYQQNIINDNNNNDDDNNDENENENNQNDQLLSVAEQREERRKLLLKAAELRKSKLKIK